MFRNVLLNDKKMFKKYNFGDNKLNGFVILITKQFKNQLKNTLI